jgi:5,6-dimethylbenzimidazole synthase
VTCNPDANRGGGLGRRTMPETALYSTVCAVQNFWLAARTEGVGVGWVSILSPSELRKVLHIPETIIPVAYLCVGFVSEFLPSPELERRGWERRVPVETLIHRDFYADPSNGDS